MCVSPLDDFCDLSLPVSDALLLVGEFPHLVLQLPVGAAHLLKHAGELRGDRRTIELLFTRLPLPQSLVDQVCDSCISRSPFLISEQ